MDDPLAVRILLVGGSLIALGLILAAMGGDQVTTYTDGPADQPWEVGSDGDGWFVQRYGWSDRVAPIDAPTERLFYVDTEDHAHSLAAQRNGSFLTRLRLRR